MKKVDAAIWEGESQDSKRRLIRSSQQADTFQE